VTYTSGSTGVPKGVAVPQRVRAAPGRGRRLREITEEDVFPATRTRVLRRLHAGDLGCAPHGARLVLAHAASPYLQTLGRVLREQEVSVLWLTARSSPDGGGASPGSAPGAPGVAGGDVLHPLRCGAI
jgi:acyl-coenzyme A synthetase/AMP-(fatty) acid ligase